jgi:hypothetical protein
VYDEIDLMGGTLSMLVALEHANKQTNKQTSKEKRKKGKCIDRQAHQHQTGQGCSKPGENAQIQTKKNQVCGCALSYRMSNVQASNAIERTLPPGTVPQVSFKITFSVPC